MKKIFTILLLITFCHLQIVPVYAYQLIPEYLCEIGIKFYQQGRLIEALKEFNKVLLIEPHDATAMDYIKRIKRLEELKQQKNKPVVSPVVSPGVSVGRREMMEETLALVEKQIPPRKENKPAEVAATSPSPYFKLVKSILKPMIPEGVSTNSIPGKAVNIEVAPTPPVINLDTSTNTTSQLIEIEQHKSMIISGAGIQRYLVTTPNILKVERSGPDKLLVTGDNIGYTYLQIWDSRGRQTLEFFTGFPKPNVEMLEEKMRLVEEKAQNFKLGYSMDWSLYEEGRSLSTLSRTSYSFIHNLSLAGETPYGDLDSALSVNRFQTKTELGRLTIGLTHGKIGPFSEFTFRGFDFFDWPPDFANLTFPGISLRGAMLNSPAFHDKFNYTVFIGRENWAGFGNLSPDINKTKKSYLDGLNLRFMPTKSQDYQFTFVQGFGRDRNSILHDFGYDISGKIKSQHWKLMNETAYDSHQFANVFNTSYTLPKLNLGVEFRDINRKFNSSSGPSSRQGELGSLFNIYYEPWDKLMIQTTLDIYRDRLNPALDNSTRFNEDLNWNANYRIDPMTSLRFNYLLQNDLGKLSQYRYQSANLGLTKNIKLIKDINLYSDYYHQESVNYNAHGSDYVNDRIYAGLRLNLVRSLYYYLNKEQNWLQESYTGNASKPSALETGLDWSSQIGKTPLYGSMRFTYRNEEDTLSQLSFLSGQDYIEGYSQLSYRPTSDMEIYASCRVRNVWADNPRVVKHVEANINGGMRYLWDTGVNWQPVGDIDGFVFKDYNADGIMQRNEPPVDRVRVYLGKKKSLITDTFGYYRFKSIRGRKAYVNLDTTTLPSGFVLTVPATQGTFIEQNGAVRLNFGIVSRSEIYGFVFEDVNNNGIYDKDDIGIRDAVIILEDNTRKVTDSSGRFSFSNIAVGEHTVTLDLDSLPVYYLPKVALTKKLILSEGMSYFYNIPLKRTK